jgi:hypothetical protein
VTQHTNPSSDLGNLYGSAFIAASQAGLDRTTRMYGHATLHLQDRVKAMNFILQHEGATAVSPRELIAIQLVSGALGLLRAEEGQELAVLATMSSELAALASTYEVAKEAKPEPRLPSAHTPEMNKALETPAFPPRTAPKPIQLDAPKHETTKA